VAPWPDGEWKAPRLRIDAQFVTSAAGAGDFPRDRLPEVALIGRSNVGKSTLINALARSVLARTSAAPGKTRLANFYRVRRGSGPELYLVDLPGYGYARGGNATSKEFNRLTEAYFARARGAGRTDAHGLAGNSPAADVQEKDIAALLLVDARHPGLESDLDAWEWLKTQPCPRGVVGTKVDKLTRAERMRNTRQLESLFDVPALLVSAQDGEGLEELWKLIARLPNQTAA
jgi:GTP-binding protein